MNSLKRAIFAATVVLASTASMAQAGVYQFSVTTGLTDRRGFEALPTANPFRGDRATATFTYTGALNFVNTAPQNGPSNPPGDLNSSFGFTDANITNYSGSGTVTFRGVEVANFATEAGFLGSSGSVSGYHYGSLYTIVLGAIAAGTNLVIRHDDGISLFRDGARVPGGIAGPTPARTASFLNLDGGNYTLYYSRQSGTPSVLTVAVPAPASLALFGAGLLGLAAFRRQKKAATKA